jgi:carbon-monoxide dehydrogenase medium subunit
LERRSDGMLLATTQSGLAPFALYRPDTLQQASEAMRDASRPVSFYAGGTDFFAAVREGLQPATVIWLDRLEGSKTISRDADHLVLGGGLTHEDVATNEALDAVPGLADAWGRIATVRIRRHATLGGNLMALRPRYELSILLTALGATARLATADGDKVVPVEMLWDIDSGGPALLIDASIPLGGAPRLDYARDLRPTMTQALCWRDGGAARRLVVATEYLRPLALDLGPKEPPVLPQDFADPIADQPWLQHVAATQYARQVSRLEAMS